MPVCQNCGETWSWGQTMKSLFKLKLKCPHCGEKQYESAASRKRSSTVMLIPIIWLPINALLDLTMGVSLIFLIILSLVVFSLYPFILNLSNEKEALW